MKESHRFKLFKCAVITAAVLAFGGYVFLSNNYWNEDMFVPIITHTGTDGDENDDNTTVTASTESSIIDLNNTSVSELTEIKGIGNETAEKIIEYAQNHGFNSVDELTNVNGIGESKLEAIRPYVTVYVTAETTFAEDDAAVIFSDGKFDADAEDHENNVTYTETAPVAAAVTFPLDLNTASADELTQIKGVGDALASRICEYAQSTGFSSVSDLMNVNGVGDSKFAAISPYVTVLNPVTSAEATTVEATTLETTAVTFPLDLNTASADELTQINGVGDVLASRICEYAKSTGFSSVSDLMNVKGVGDSKFAAISPYVTVLNPVTPAETTTPETTAAVSETTVSADDDIFPIELNTATKEELVKINGIGDVMAEKIIEYAQSTGFTCVDDLVNVNGIGEKKLENIRPYVYVK
jgi:competence protein ComEA